MIYATITYACDICHKVETRIIQVEFYEEITIADIPGWKHLPEYYGDSYQMKQGGPWQYSIWPECIVCPECLAKHISVLADKKRREAFT